MSCIFQIYGYLVKSFSRKKDTNNMLRINMTWRKMCYHDHQNSITFTYVNVAKSSDLKRSGCILWICSIAGSVVECSPATRAARVRFPDDANNFVCFSVHHLLLILGKNSWNMFVENEKPTQGMEPKGGKNIWRRGVSIPLPLTC